MPDPLLDWLLAGEPVVAYRARVDLLGLREDNAQVRAARDAMLESAPPAMPAWRPS